MKSYKRIIVGIKLDEDKAALDFFKELEFLKGSTIQIVHVSRITDDLILGEMNLPFFPSDETKIIIERTIIKKLEEFKEHVFSGFSHNEVSAECVFSSNPKKDFLKFVEENEADLIILADQKSKNAFGGFTHYQFTHGKCPIFILRPKISSG